VNSADLRKIPELHDLSTFPCRNRQMQSLYLSTIYARETMRDHMDECSVSGDRVPSRSASVGSSYASLLLLQSVASIIYSNAFHIPEPLF
jgi:hypothetical protein